jgi:hypothetical protein
LQHPCLFEWQLFCVSANIRADKRSVLR